jgi:hypothetical protein
MRSVLKLRLNLVIVPNVNHPNLMANYGHQAALMMADQSIKLKNSIALVSHWSHKLKLGEPRWSSQTGSWVIKLHCLLCNLHNGQPQLMKVYKIRTDPVGVSLFFLGKVPTNVYLVVTQLCDNDKPALTLWLIIVVIFMCPRQRYHMLGNPLDWRLFHHVPPVHLPALWQAMSSQRRISKPRELSRLLLTITFCVFLLFFIYQR